MRYNISHTFLVFSEKKNRVFAIKQNVELDSEIDDIDGYDALGYFVSFADREEYTELRQYGKDGWDIAKSKDGKPYIANEWLKPAIDLAKGKKVDEICVYDKYHDTQVYMPKLKEALKHLQNLNDVKVEGEEDIDELPPVAEDSIWFSVEPDTNQ